MTFDGLDLLGADALEDVRSGSSVLKKGTKGDAVKDLQGKLGVDADGDFGGKTEAAVKSFQASHGLSADGVVGKNTLAAIEKAPAATHIDFTEDEVITASAPKPVAQGAGAGAASGSKSGALLTWPFGGGSARAESAPVATSEAEATKKRNTYIAIGLGVLGAAGLAIAWKR